jgi:multisubunit Na+/H+ antiporter MnhE subunit
MTRRIKFWVAWYVPLGGLWLALVGTLDRNEVLLGLLAAALGATAQELVNAQDLVRFRLEPRWLRGLWRLPGQALADTWRLTVVLWRQLLRGQAVSGSFRALPYRAPPEDEARANARKALITAAVSVTPNTYVVGIEGDDRFILVHRLLPDAGDPVPPVMLDGQPPGAPAGPREVR